MARGFSFVRPAIFCALLAFSLQLPAQQHPPGGSPPAGRHGRGGAGDQQPSGGGGGAYASCAPADPAVLARGKARIGVLNAPQAYVLNNHQNLLTMAGDTLFAFTIY